MYYFFSENNFIYQKSKHYQCCFFKEPGIVKDVVDWEFLLFVARKQNITEKMRRMFQLCLNRWKNKCIYLSLAFYYTTMSSFLGLKQAFTLLSILVFGLNKCKGLLLTFKIMCYTRDQFQGWKESCTSLAVTSKNHRNGNTGKDFNIFWSPP